MGHLPQIGLLTIGQSPCSNMVTDARQIVGPNVHLDLIGALDGLTPQQVKLLAPQDDEARLVTKLASGQPVIVKRAEIEQRLPDAIDILQQRGAQVIVVLCTGTFDLDGPVPLLLPGDLTTNVVAAMRCVKSLAVLYPVAEQLDQIKSKWERLDLDVSYLPAHPYTPQCQFHNSCLPLADIDPDLVILDCMGYNENHRAAVHSITSAPCIVTFTAALGIATELIS